VGAGRQPAVAVVGAGLAGSLVASCLADRGYRVDVYERRGDPRAGTGAGTERSINLGLSARGIGALRQVGIWDTLAPLLVPMRGRMIHRGTQPPRLQPYGRDPAEILHSIRRGDLNAALVDRAEKCPDVRFHFRSRCEAVDLDTATLTVVTADGTRTERGYDFVVGADGASSAVRADLLRGRPVSYAQDFLDWGYKELTIRAFPDGTARTPIEALHVWPGEGFLVVAHPNADRSLTCTLLLPLHSTGSGGSSGAGSGAGSGTGSGAGAWTGFDRLPTGADAVRFAEPRLPDLLDLIPDFAAQYDAHPVSHLVTIRVGRWHHAGRVVLIGDACHAVTPFYGQGMNAAFEDCVVLARCLDERPDPGAAFAEYQRLRKPHTDVLADLCMTNFVELRDNLRRPGHLAKARADHLLNRAFPTVWRPLYTLVSHTDTPYGDAVRQARRQDRALAAAAVAGLAGIAAAAGYAIRRAAR
jgi:kynurenine 3-monooxygenase